MQGGLGTADELVLTSLTEDGKGSVAGSSGFEQLSAEAGRWTLAGGQAFETVSVAAPATLVALQGFSGMALVDGQLDVAGTISGLQVNDGGTMSIGERGTLATVEIDGDVTIAGTVLVDIDENGSRDRLVAEGGITLEEETARLEIHALSGSYIPDSQYTLMIADTVSGEFEEVVDDLAFLDALVTINSNSVVLTLTRNGTALIDIARTKNQKAVAAAIGAAEGSDLYDLIIGMSEDEARDAFDHLSGEVHATTAGVLTTQADLVNSAIEERIQAALWSVAGGSGADLPEAAAWDEGTPAAVATGGLAYAGWVKGYGSWLEADGDGNAAGMDGTAGGFLAGFDVASANGMIGLAVGYGIADVSVDSRDSETDTETFLLAAYGAYRFDAVRLSGGVSYGAASIDSERHVLGETPTASYDGDTASVFGEVAYDARMGGVDLQPFAGLAYTNVDLDGFTEENAPLSGLTSDGQSFDSLSSTIGLRLAYDMVVGGGMVMTPRASVGWRHAYGDVTPETVMTFQDTGTSFAVQGLPIAQDTAVIEAGIDMALTPNATLGILYEGQFAERASANSVKATAALRF